MADSGFNNNTLKHRNRRLILRLLATGRCGSRIDIARETGLSKMASTNIINEFISEGIVCETEKQLVKGKGRNPILLGLSPRAPKLMGVRIGRDFCESSICDLKLDVLDSRRFEINNYNANTMLDHILDDIGDLLSAHRDEKILGIGIGSVGPVDIMEGKILDPLNYFNVPDLRIRDIVEEKFGFPVIFLNEYDCATLKELFLGKGKDIQEFIFIGISEIVGSGIAVRNKLYRSNAGFNCEFGHTCIDYNGLPCSCGRKGCVQAYISTDKVAEKLSTVTGENLSFTEFCLKYEHDAPEEVDEIFLDMAKKLSYAISNVVDFTCIVDIVVGHEGSYIPDRYLDECMRMTNERIVFRGLRKVNIYKSEINKEITSSSCASAVLDVLLSENAEELL